MLFRSILFLGLFLTTFCDARIHFIHISKTGGSTIKTLLKENFTYSQIYSYNKIKFKIMPYLYKPQSWEKILREKPTISEDIAMGHLPYWFLINKDPDFDQSFCFTVLRDPIDRVISHYFYSSSNGRKKIDSPLSLPSNVTCKMLCSNPTLKGEALLNDCIATLHKMDFIIFQDDFDNGVKQVFKILNLNLPEQTIPKINATKHGKLSKEMIQKIGEANSLDVQLYEYAKRTFSNQI